MDDRAIDFFGRHLTRAHALLLTYTCAALLLLNLPQASSRWPAFTWAGSSAANETEIDAALQAAAENAIADHDAGSVARRFDRRRLAHGLSRPLHRTQFLARLRSCRSLAAVHAFASHRLFVQLLLRNV